MTWHITNLEQAQDATHGFALAGYNINLSLEPGEATTIELRGRQAGRLPVLLHRVLLGAAPGDDGLLPGQPGSRRRLTSKAGRGRTEARTPSGARRRRRRKAPGGEPSIPRAKASSG